MAKSSYYGFTGGEVATMVATQPPGGWYVTYHGTTVFTLSADGTVTLNTGGWDTATTRRRMNQALRHFNITGHVYRDGGQTYVDGVNGCPRTAFDHNVTVDANGNALVGSK